MRINPTSGRNSNDQILDFIRAIASARNQGQVKTIITTVPVLATLGTGGFLKGNVWPRSYRLVDGWRGISMEARVCETRASDPEESCDRGAIRSSE